MSGPAPEFHVEREACASREDFLRQLRLVFPDCVLSGEGAATIADGRATLEITLTPLEPRTIALLTLPRLKVSLRGTAGKDQELAALLARMDLAMRRGGG
jgi:hypothetical protein